VAARERIDPRAVARACNVRVAGGTLREAAVAAGVHVATLCRWQAASPAVRELLKDAAAKGRPRKGRSPREPRPQVRWHRDCPMCRLPVVVRTAPGGIRFWRCRRWPWCRWSSWRPRAPRNCRRCGAPCFWSHSRKSVACGACGLRTGAPLTALRDRGEIDPFGGEEAWF
jgi:hypothetical protein